MRILFVTHGFPPTGSGGAEIYAAQQASLLAARGDDVSVFARVADRNRPEYATQDEKRAGVSIRWINRTFRDATSFVDGYVSDRVREEAAMFIDVVRPDVVHIHHLTCLSTTIVGDIKARGIPVVLTLHDYWMLCHRGQLLDLDLRPCASIGACGRCAGAAASAATGTAAGSRAARAVREAVPASAIRVLAGFVDRIGTTVGPSSVAVERARLEHMQSVLHQVDRHLAPCPHVRQRFIGAGVDPERISLVPYGVDLERYAPRPSAPVTNRPLRLGFVGSLMVSKGPHLLVQAWQRLPAGRAVVAFAGAVAGYHGDDSFRETLRPLLAIPGVENAGVLPHDDVPAFMRSLDVLVVPSIWEETGPLVAREAFASGVPVIGSRIGGLAETITDGVDGLLFEPGNVADLARQLQRVLDDPDVLPRLRDGITRPLSVQESTRETRAIYESLVGSRAGEARVARPGSQASQNQRVAAVVLNYKTPDETLLAVRALMASRQALSSIIVVDNDSADSCRRMLEDVMDAIVFISAGSNTGFSAGVNLGIAHALDHGATHVLLVNSDVILPVGALSVLAEVLAADPRRGVVAPVTASRRAPMLVASAGMRYSGRTGRMRHLDAGSRIAPHARPAWTPVSGVSGCAMLIRREVFEAVGLLEEPYFFSFEDLAFCLAARDRGFEVGVAGQALAYHEGSRSLGATSVRRLYFAARNHLLLASQRPGNALERSLRAVAIVGYNAAHAVIAPGGILPTRLIAVANGVRDHLRGRYGSDEDVQA